MMSTYGIKIFIQTILMYTWSLTCRDIEVDSEFIQFLVDLFIGFGSSAQVVKVVKSQGSFFVVEATHIQHVISLEEAIGFVGHRPQRNALVYSTEINILMIVEKYGLQRWIEVFTIF